MHDNELENRHLRIFISSTFKDTQKEREKLAQEVFPKIRKIAKEKDAEVTEIDLRWGITEEEARSGEALLVCLEEIYKCMQSPLFFIGIIDGVYGSVPHSVEEHIKEHLYNDERFKNLFYKYPHDKTSFTELETRFGVLENERVGKDLTALIYKRNENLSKEILDGLGIKQDGTEKEKINNLIQDIKNKGIDVKEYNSFDEFVEMVSKDLEDNINKIFKDNTSVSNSISDSHNIE